MRNIIKTVYKQKRFSYSKENAHTYLQGFLRQTTQKQQNIYNGDIV